MDVGETEVTALHAVGEPLVVHPEQVEHRRVEVVDVHRAADRGEADLIGLAVRVPGLDPAACHPEREGLDMVVAAELLPHLAQRVRPNSPPQTTKVSSSIPRDSRSRTSAADARSTSLALASSGLPRWLLGSPWWSQSVW